jgi:hypothetical protein
VCDGSAEGIRFRGCIYGSEGRGRGAPQTLETLSDSVHLSDGVSPSGGDDRLEDALLSEGGSAGFGGTMVVQLPLKRK